MLTEFFQGLGGVLISAKAIWFSILYVLGGMAIIWPPYNRELKFSIFALYNIALTYWFFFSNSDPLIWRFLAYIVFACFHFFMLKMMKLPPVLFSIGLVAICGWAAKDLFLAPVPK